MGQEIHMYTMELVFNIRNIFFLDCFEYINSRGSFVGFFFFLLGISEYIHRDYWKKDIL